MRILVTGAGGRIGARLMDLLGGRGHAVIGYDRQPPARAANGPHAAGHAAAGHEVVIGDLADDRRLDAAMAGVDAVAHLAAVMTWQPERAGELFRANVHGTFNVLQAARRHGVERVAFASSGEVYPELQWQYCPLDERHPLRPTSAYGLTKVLGERMVEHLAHTSDIRCCILRFAHTQEAVELLDARSFFSGPRFFVTAKIDQLRRLPPAPATAEAIARLRAVAAGGEQLYVGCDERGVPYRMALCDARDLVAGIALALERSNRPCDVFNLGPAASFDFDDAVDYMARLTGLPVTRVALPTTPYRYDTAVDKARRELGYEPRYTIRDMIDEAAAWWRRARDRRSTGAA